MIEYILNPQSVEALGWTLLHSLWQGAVFAILLVLILIALRSYTAQSRYIVAVGLLCAFFLTVSATFWQQWQEANSQFELAAQQLNNQPTDDVFLLNNNAEKALRSNSESESTPLSNSEVSASDQSGWLVVFRDYYDRHLPLLVTIWFLGVLFLQLRFLGQLAYAQRLKHYGTQLFPATWSDKIEELEGKLRIQKKVNYLTSIRIESPMVIGWLKPVVLMPRQLLNSLSETEIYAVLAHELAHIRREDFIVNLMQTFLCNIFFFHPGVWWMSNRIDEEREHCCDDLAVTVTGPAVSYAKTLINVSELKLRMQGKTALSMAFSGKRKNRERGGFSGRIHRLFRVSNGTGTFREGFSTACILVTALFFGVIATSSTTVQTTDSQTLSENNNTEIISNSEPANDIEFKQNNKITTTTTTIKDNPISKINPTVSSSELLSTPPKPQAPPEPIAPPEPQVEPVISDETRIDALVMACEEGDFDFVKTLVNAGIDVNGIGSGGFTPLMMAVSEDEVEIVEYLLQQGANVNQTYEGWTALIEAADEGSFASMKHLLKARADVDYYDTPDSPTAISMAASEGELNCLKLLLENGADINGIGKSVPPLHIAAAENKGAIIDYLISQNVNINEKDAEGRTALMYAAAEGHKHSAAKLIEAGAGISIADSNGATARDYAEGQEEYNTLEYLEAEKAKADERHSHERGTDSEIRGKHSETLSTRPEIHQATLDGLIEKVERMVDEGTYVDIPDDYGRTPLHIASAENHNIDMQVLIDLGANVNAQDSQGRTPLMYAAAAGHENAAALLVSRQANVHIEDVDGMRAYEWARSGGNRDLTEFLGLITKNQPRTDNERNTHTHVHTNTHQHTHIHKHVDDKSSQKEQEKRLKKQEKDRMEKAIQKEHEKRETFHITDKGYHLKQFDIEGEIPELLELVRDGSVDDCRKLLNSNDDLSVNNSDDTGQTALMVAASNNRLDIAKFLIKNGADVNMSSVSGLTALHYAALENHHEMARLLLKNNAKVDATMHYSSTDGNYDEEPLVWEYIGATPLLIAVEAGNIQVLSVLMNAGANPYHTLHKNTYIFNENHATYLTGSEVMGLDKDFLKHVKIKISDDTWTPYKQALLLNEPAILAIFPK